jgi:hypothetical protein
LAKTEPRKLLERAQKAFNVRDANRNLFDDCYELYSPYRNTLSKQGMSHNTPTRQYDSTGQISAQNFINTIQSNFTPPFTKWASLEPGEGWPEEKKQEVQIGLDVITDIIFAYLNASNFASAVTEMYFEWGIGTGCLWLYEGDRINPFNFVCTPISQIGIDEGANGSVDFRVRKHNMKGNLIKVTWPKAEIPNKIAADIKQNPEKEICLHEVFYYDYEEFKHRYDVIIEDDCIYYEEMEEEMVFTPRWLKIPGNPYGVGPFILSLADTKTINKLKEYLLRTSALDVAGVYTITSDGALNPNTINIAPNTFIPVERNNGENGPTIQRLDTSTNFQLQEYMMNDLKDSIRKTLLDNRLPAETPQPKTAFEIALRMREFQINIGSAYGRGMFELIQPMFKRMIGILARQGLININKDEFKLDNLYSKVKITSPIAQTQQAEEVQKVMQNYQMIQAINPELALTSYEVEKFPQWLNEMTGAPAKLLRLPAAAEQMQKAMAQAAVQQQQGA